MTRLSWSEEDINKILGMGKVSPPKKVRKPNPRNVVPSWYKPRKFKVVPAKPIWGTRTPYNGQPRDAKGRLGKKTSPPNPSDRLVKAKIKRVAGYIPRGFVGTTYHEPTHKMGLREKSAELERQRKANVVRNKTRVRMAKRRNTVARRTLRKAFNKIW